MTTEKIVLDSEKYMKNKMHRKLIDEAESLNIRNNGKGIDIPKEKFSTNQSNINIINAYSRNKRLDIMVIGAALGLIFCLLMLTFYKKDLPGEVVGIISTISGIFGTCLRDAYNFEFGSSRGSKDKDDKISSTILERIGSTIVQN